MARRPDLRFAYLYSAPLMRQLESGARKPVEALNVQAERAQLRDLVRASKLAVHWYAGAATVRNVRDAITRGACVVGVPGPSPMRV